MLFAMPTFTQIQVVIMFRLQFQDTLGIRQVVFGTHYPMVLNKYILFSSSVTIFSALLHKWVEIKFPLIYATKPLEIDNSNKALTTEKEWQKK